MIRRLIAILLCTMLLAGCAVAPQILPEVTIESTPVHTQSPTPEPSAEVWTVDPEAVRAQVKNEGSVLGVLLSRGGNCSVAPEAIIEEGAEEVTFEEGRMRLPPGAFYAIAREGRLCYPVLLDWDVGQQQALVECLTQARFREVEYAEIMGFFEPSVHLVYITRQDEVWDFEVSRDAGRELAPIVCSLRNAQGGDQRYFAVEGEGLDALLDEEWRVRQPELPGAEDIVRAEVVNYATGEHMLLGEQEVDRMLALMERSEVEMRGEKVSVYCEFTWELNSGKTLHGVLDSSFGVIGLEDTLYMLNSRDVDTYTDLFGTFLQR